METLEIEYLELKNKYALKKKKLLFYTFVLSTVLFVFFLASISIGSYSPGLTGSFSMLSKIISGKLTESERIIVLKIRFPRVLMAIFAGGGLSAAGAILQAIIRNPLAEPYILGISSGAAFGAVISMVLAGGFLFVGTPLSAFAGASLVAIFVYLLARRKGTIDVNTMLLTGIMTGAFFYALILVIISVSKRNITNFLFWLIGNLSNVGFKQSIFVSGVVFASVIASYIYANMFNLLATGEETAKHLGVDVERLKRNSYFLASLITGVIVSVSGVIGFVGLVVPHVCRNVFGPDYRILLPMSFLSGAIFLLLADTIARVIISPAELPVGAITVLIGAPFFIYLLKK